MGARRVKNVGPRPLYHPGTSADWLAKLRRDAKTHQAKSEQRKENRRRDAQANRRR